MLEVTFVSAHPAGNCQLITGERSAFLIDCSVSFCARDTAFNIERALHGRKLQAIILSHSHYDHVTGLPYIRDMFGNVPVYAHPYAAEVFSRPGAVSLMNAMCENANALFGKGFAASAPRVFELDVTDTLADGQVFPFDGGRMQILFTPGHTKDSVSIDFPDEGITWVCETLGVRRPDGLIQPCFLSGYNDALGSVKRIKSLGARRYILSHRAGLLSHEESADYLSRAERSMTDSAELICRLYNEGRDENGIFEGYKAVYWSELYKDVWPYRAFSLNAEAAIKTVIKELCQ